MFTKIRCSTSGLIGKKGKNEIISRERRGADWYPGLLSGSEIRKYIVNYEGNFIRFNTKILKSGFKDANYFVPKILLRQTGDSLVAAYDDNNMLCLNLAKKRVDFAFETTLASKTFASWIINLCKTGYDFHLVFLWLPSDDFAVARVAERVRMGGHNVPEEIIRRRYHAGIKNFFRLYKPLADFWRVYDNSDPAGPRLIASSNVSESDNIKDIEIWNMIMGKLRYEKEI